MRDIASRRSALRRAARAVARFPQVRNKRPHGLSPPLIVSLTSYPPRFPTLAATLKSLLDQEVAADRTILWLGRDDVDLLPPDVRALEAHGLDIRPCEDMRSFTKLVPALSTFPEAVIVTADDDIYYRSDWLGKLVSEAQATPHAVIAHRAHLAIRNEDGAFIPYRDWRMATAARSDSKESALFPTGVGGVLYPPGALDTRVFDIPTFRALCPLADDVWFFWMAGLAGTERRNIGDGAALIEWNGTQDVGLLHQNWMGAENDRQIAAMERHFGHFPYRGAPANRPASLVSG